jgi:signal transduction histidine kinase
MIGNYKAYNILHKINYWKLRGVDPSFLFEGTDINYKNLKETDWLDFLSQIRVIWGNELNRVPDPREHEKLGYDVHQNQSMGAMEIAAKLFSLKFIFKKFADFGKKYSLVETYQSYNVTKNSAVIIYSPKQDFLEYFSFSSPNFVKGFLKSMSNIHLPASAKEKNVFNDADVTLEMSYCDIEDVLLKDYRWLTQTLNVEWKDNFLIVNKKPYAKRIYLKKDPIKFSLFSKKKAIKEKNYLLKKLESEKQANCEHDFRGQDQGVLVTKNLYSDNTLVLKKGEVFNAPYCRFNIAWSNISLSKRVSYFFNDVPLLIKSSRQSLLNQIEIADQRYFYEMQARQKEADAKKDLEKANIKLKEYADNLEDKVEERTLELKETQAKLLESEKRTLEHRITGGFAHEMRNALAGAQLEFKNALNYQGLNKTSSEVLKVSATTLLKKISKIHGKYNIPKETIASDFIPELKTIAEISDTLSNIHSGVSRDIDRGLAITSQIRDYAKMSEMKKGETEIDIVQLLKGYEDQYKNDFEKYGIEYSVNGVDQTIVKADEIHLNSIFSNLILNAKDAFFDTKIENPKINVHIEKIQDQIKIEVKDNGPGIKDEHLKEIFEPFFSTKPTTGTGLGLGVVQKLVQLYGGKIEVESGMGIGTIFTIILPEKINE